MTGPTQWRSPAQDRRGPPGGSWSSFPGTFRNLGCLSWNNPEPCLSWLFNAPCSHAITLCKDWVHGWTPGMDLSPSYLTAPWLPELPDCLSTHKPTMTHRIYIYIIYIYIYIPIYNKMHLILTIYIYRRYVCTYLQGYMYAFLLHVYILYIYIYIHTYSYTCKMNATCNTHTYTCTCIHILLYTCKDVHAYADTLSDFK